MNFNNDIWNKRREKLEEAVIKSALDLSKHTQSSGFRLGIPATSPQLYVSVNSDKPVDMILFCPSCGLQHIDAPQVCEEEGCPHYPTQHSHPNFWMNPPHRSHLCQGCGHQWRPSDQPTNGVLSINSRGQNDSDAAVLIIGGIPTLRKDFMDEVLLAIAEMPDRTGPEVFPEAMLVTGQELRDIVSSIELTFAERGEIIYTKKELP